MTQAFEDARKGDVTSNHYYEPIHQKGSALIAENELKGSPLIAENELKGSALIAENEIKEHIGEVHTCCRLDKTLSRNPFLDSSIENKWYCCPSTNRGFSSPAKIAEEIIAGKNKLSSCGFESVQTYERHTCAGKSKCICISISIVVNIALLIAVALLATMIGNTGETDANECPILHLPKDFIKDSLCLPCNYLGSAVKVEDTLFDVTSSCGHKFCCVKNGGHQKLFLLMLQEGHRSKGTNENLTTENFVGFNLTLSTWRSRTFAAHLYANVTSLPEKLTWQNDTGYGSAFTQGITLTPESRLQVPHAGIYFIYSVLTLRCQLGSASRVHLITRQHKGRPKAGIQPLLLSKTSECGPDGIYTSFLAGVQSLKSNDELSVNLTDVSLTSLYKSSLSNYFGAYLV